VSPHTWVTHLKLFKEALPPEAEKNAAPFHVRRRPPRGERAATFLFHRGTTKPVLHSFFDTVLLPHLHRRSIGAGPPFRKPLLGRPQENGVPLSPLCVKQQGFGIFNALCGLHRRVRHPSEDRSPPICILGVVELISGTPEVVCYKLSCERLCLMYPPGGVNITISDLVS